ncbi:MAG: hypothetical protein WAU82_06315 [Candidatus Binatus sp.]|uniref:hypothetical protein n=1 Tax=Candidatus Binatus sp. TaxID=2811406 RepID=UPI003BAF9E0B
MRAESRALANVLLERHRTICRPLGRRDFDDVDNNDIDVSITSYGDLCEQAGLGREFARAARNFLFEIAQWCDEHEWPPLNALAVNAQTGYPGDGYSEAPGCQDWPNDVKRAIGFAAYPLRVE